MQDQVFKTSYARWYFWDQNGQFFYGPYDTEDEAHAALADFLQRAP